MRRSKGCFILYVILVAALMGFPFFMQQADARGGGGGFHGGGGFSGGSFRGGGGYAEGPRGGGVAEGPRGGVAARGPEGGAVARGPEGGVAARGPDGDVYAEGHRAASDWDHFHGPGWDNAVAGAAANAAAVGFTDTLPVGATAVVVGDQNYYVANGVYYQECYMGSEVNYCTVPDPRQ